MEIEVGILLKDIRMANTPWYRELIKYDPVNYIAKIKVPVLALNGDKDIKVPSKENLKSIKENLQKGGNKKNAVIELPNHNHYFQHAKIGSDKEAQQLEEVFSEEALLIIADWLKSIM